MSKFQVGTTRLRFDFSSTNVFSSSDVFGKKNTVTIPSKTDGNRPVDFRDPSTKIAAAVSTTAAASNDSCHQDIVCFLNVSSGTASSSSSSSALVSSTPVTTNHSIKPVIVHTFVAPVSFSAVPTFSNPIREVTLPEKPCTTRVRFSPSVRSNKRQKEKEEVSDVDEPPVCLHSIIVPYCSMCYQEGTVSPPDNESFLDQSATINMNDLEDGVPPLCSHSIVIPFCKSCFQEGTLGRSDVELLIPNSAAIDNMNNNVDVPMNCDDVPPVPDMIISAPVVDVAASSLPVLSSNSEILSERKMYCYDYYNCLNDSVVAYADEDPNFIPYLGKTITKIGVDSVLRSQASDCLTRKQFLFACLYSKAEVIQWLNTNNRLETLCSRSNLDVHVVRSSYEQVINDLSEKKLCGLRKVQFIDSIEPWFQFVLNTSDPEKMFTMGTLQRPLFDMLIQPMLWINWHLWNVFYLVSRDSSSKEEQLALYLNKLKVEHTLSSTESSFLTICNSLPLDQ